MKRGKAFWCISLWVTALAGLVLPAVSLAQVKPPANAEELVRQHLDSLGNAQSRSGVKTRLAQGTAQFRILSGGAGTLDGPSALVSEGQKLHFMVKFNNNDYRGEHFIFNGDKVQVASATSQKTRSPIGDFVYVQDTVVREGLWGGALSTAWPLLNVGEKRPKLTYEGMKTVDGQSLHDLRYKPRKNTDLEIHLYFDPETLRHVRTLYTLTFQPRLAQGGQTSAVGVPELGGPLSQPQSSETVQAQQQQTRYRLEERFTDFKTADGLTLPTHYNIRFSRELQDGRSLQWEWDIHETSVGNNIDLDPRNFEIK